MYDNDKQLEKAQNAMAAEIRASQNLLDAMGLGQAKKTDVELLQQFDGLVAQYKENKMSPEAFIPPSLQAIKETLKDPESFGYLLDSIQKGVIIYRNRHGGDMPSASLVASALCQAAVLHTLKDSSQANGLFDSAQAMGGKEIQGFFDSVSAHAHAHTAEVPSLAMVVIAATIANALPVISYLPNPMGTNSVPLVYVRQVSNLSFGQTDSNEYLDGANAALQYFDNVHRFKMTTDATRKTFTVTTKRKVDASTLVADANSGRLPILAGASSVSVGGIYVAEDHSGHATSSMKTGTLQLVAADTEGFKIGATTYKVTAGTTNIGTDTISITFDTAIPAGVDVIASVVGDYEAVDNENKPILTPPGSDVKLEYAVIHAYPIRALYTASIDAITQLQNELGVDQRAAFVAIVISKLMLEQTTRLLTDARKRARGTGRERKVDILRGSDYTVAFNKSSDIASEILPAIDDTKRRIVEDTQAQPSGFDVFVTGSLSTLCKTMADDTNFIPTAIPFGLPNSIVRIGSRGSDNFYYVPESSNIVFEGAENYTVQVPNPDTDVGGLVNEQRERSISEMLIVPRHEQAAKSQFIGHVAVPVVTGDVTSQNFTRGVQFYSRQAAQLNNNSRFGYQAWIVKVENLPKTLSEAV